MSANRLIFSFQDGLNLALSEKQMTNGAVIKFGSGFEHLEMLYDSSALCLVSREEVRDTTPAIEFAVRPKKLKLEETKLGLTPEIETLAAENRPCASENEQPLNLPTTFHEGTVEEKKRLTKTQRRNRNRRFRKKQDKLRRETEIQSLTETQRIVNHASPDVIPLVEEYVPQYIHEMHRQIVSEDELERFQNVRRQNFEHFQRVRGKIVNILEVLELYTDVFGENEQKRVLHVIEDLKERGRSGLLRPRTYSEPRKWMKGKGRITIQFGCCYNYAMDAKGNPPGILRHEDVDPIPPLLKQMIKRMVAWHVLPPESTPDSCIINIYEEGDCIPPHIDSHDFVRPFCTASFLNECNIVLGTELRIEGPGEFSGPVKIPLPVGSVLVFGGNGADLAKHCVPAVPRQRISITFRKMDERKLPYSFKPEPELQGLRPLIL